MTYTEEERKKIKSIKTMLVRCGVFLFFALAFSLYAALCPLLPVSETQSTWFQRSGAVVVVLTVWVQFELQSVKIYFDKDAYSVPFLLPKNYWSSYSFVSISNVIAMVLGTVIWGYGDILYKGFINLAYQCQHFTG